MLSEIDRVPPMIARSTRGHAPARYWKSRKGPIVAACNQARQKRASSAARYAAHCSTARCEAHVLFSTVRSNRVAHTVRWRNVSQGRRLGRGADRLGRRGATFFCRRREGTCQDRLCFSRGKNELREIGFINVRASERPAAIAIRA